MAGALEGIRVIDFGQYIAGPLAAMLLADQGADVVRVDPPTGPRWDTPANASWNRGKRSIALDLKHPEDLATARSLIASADVVIENFRPGVMDRLGLGAAAMTEVNPRLVYCSLPGFAADHPRAATPAWEGVVSAAAGMYRAARTGGGGGRPIYTALPVASTYAAIQAAVAISMALIARDRDGLGQIIAVPLFDAMFGAIGYDGHRIHQRVEGGAQALARGFGLTTQFQCADGRWIMFHTGNGNVREVFEAAGLAPEHVEAMLDRQRQASDPDVAEEVMQRARDLFASRSAQEWEDLTAQAGGECAVCRTAADWMENEHAVASQTVIDIDDPKLGRTRQPGVAVRLMGALGAVRSGAPRLDEHREAVLEEARAARGRSLPAAVESTMRAALDGVRVLDLCIVLAGPTAGRTLAEYGADVIKIEAPDRPPSEAFHVDVNRGKRSIVLDLKSEDGLAAFWRLVDSADVIAQNFRNGVAERLGISYEQVRARRPDIVYASLNTYGQVGPYADRPGHEQIAQAATGMQARFGGSERPQLQRYAVNDYGTGFLGAYGIALALLHRARTGEGQHVAGALAYTATLLQSPFLLGYEGQCWDEPAGLHQVGSGPLHRAYEAADGWLFLGARESDIVKLEAVEGIGSLAGRTGTALEAVLEERLRAASIEAWVSRLVAGGIGAHRIITDVQALMSDPWVRAHGLSVTREHEGLGPVTTIGPAARLQRTPTRPGVPAPRLGADGPAILDEVGLGDRVDALVRAGALRI